MFSASFSTFAFSADDTFTRGSLIAVDTRDHQACELAKIKVESMTTGLDLSKICRNDGSNPISVVLVTASISEFDYLSEVDRSHQNDGSVILSMEEKPGTDALVIVPNSSELNHGFKLMALKKKTKLAVMRLKDFSALSQLRYKFFTVAFVHRSPSIPLHSDLASSVETELTQVAGKLAFNAAGMNEEDSSLSIMRILKSIKSVSIDLPKGCDGIEDCTKDGFGVTITINYRF